MVAVTTRCMSFLIAVCGSYRVLAEGPDVMFAVADMDTADDTIEVLSSQFFEKQVAIQSIRIGLKPQIVFEREIDGACGAAFGAILADLDPNKSGNQPVVVDSGSTVATLKPGDSFSHLVVTSHERSTQATDTMTSTDGSGRPQSSDAVTGGSLFAYRIPQGKKAWKTKPWLRTTVASGFRVRSQLSNMISPGAPGFAYVFHASRHDRKDRPMIAVAGDCSDSAYLFRPTDSSEQHKNISDPSADYKLMCEIRCGATVGSIGIGYEDFMTAEQEDSYAKLYIPCYEKDKILVLAIGSGEGDD